MIIPVLKARHLLWVLGCHDFFERACPDRNSQFDSRHAPAANQIDHVTLRPGAAALAMATNTLRVFLRSPKQARLAAGWAARASRRCHAKAEVRV